jgi:hypothetical protein
VLQEVRIMRFEEVVGRLRDGRLTCEAAADVLGMSVSSFFRWRRPFEAEGIEGLADRRIGKASARRAPVDEVAKLLELFETRYFDCNVLPRGAGRARHPARLHLDEEHAARARRRKSVERTGVGGPDGGHDAAPGRLAARIELIPHIHRKPRAVGELLHCSQRGCHYRYGDLRAMSDEAQQNIGDVQRDMSQ